MGKRIAVLVLAVIFAVGILVGGFAEKAYAKEVKMGYVFMAKVFDEYYKTTDSEKVLSEKGTVKEAERKKMIDELKKMKDEQSLLSDKAKQEKQAAIDSNLKVLQSFDLKTRDELLKERNDMLSGIMGDITKVITDYAKAEGYDVVLNSDPRVMLYGVDGMDITATILAKLNKK
ncbi:MAG: OmpH family outer membrane protein [Candidatus Omnitrophica bacterium]|nr:OmpH family outer membrane protein [Candidatus Omnitrophota bacterium]